jgi:lipopolysaccharide export system protein LptA
MIRKTELLAVLAFGASLAAHALASDRQSQKLPALSGPVTITADRAEFEQDGVMRYRGNVRLVSNQLVLTGESLELRQPASGQYETRVSGRPARLTHAGEGAAPPVSASAGQIYYDTRTAVIELSQNAQLERGTDRLTGESIRYEVEARRIQASGANGGQVRIVIQPPESKTEPGSTP